MRVVQITIEGVRDESIPRLRTAIKTHLVKFGRKLEVVEGEEKPGLFNKKTKTTAPEKVERSR